MISKQKIVTGGLFLNFAIAMLQAAHTPRNMLFMDPGTMDIMTYPKVLLYGLCAAVLVYLFLPSSETPSDWKGVLACWPMLAGSIASYGVYAFLFEYIGLGVSTFVFMLCFFWVMQYRKWSRALPIALAGATITWLVFEKILGIPMPVPIWVGIF